MSTEQPNELEECQCYGNPCCCPHLKQVKEVERILSKFERTFAVWNNKWVFAERPDSQNTATVQDVVDYLRQILTPLIEDRDAKAREEWYLGKKIQAFGEDYIVVGVSRMIYDEDCEGEPEWKITHDVQEVAIAKEMEGDSFQKPSWHKAIALSHNIDLSIKK